MTSKQLKDFLVRLAGIEGCNVQGPGSIFNWDHKTWDCAGNHDLLRLETHDFSRW